MASALTAISEGLADAVAAAGQSVVTVHARRRIPATGIIWSPGVIVTADHVIENDEEITVTLPGGGRVAATLAGRDPSSEIAVLRVQESGEGTGVAAPRREAPLRVGNLVLAVGRPFDGLSASLGLVVAVGQRPADSDRGTTAIRHDAAMYPGYSGGPLIDAEGGLVGMNTTGFGGATVTLPHQRLAAVVDVILKHGRVPRGYLGIGTQQAKLPEAQATKTGLDQQTGLLIIAVEPESPAGRAGLLVGDILVKLGDVAIGEAGDLHAALRGRVGEETSVVVVRGGEPATVAVTIGERQ